MSSLAWNRESKEIISSHGNPKNHLAVWKCSTMCKVGEITGHQGRILQMSLSPRKSSVATLSADETLRVWKCFDQPPEKSADSSRKSLREDSISALIRNAPWLFLRNTLLSITFFSLLCSLSYTTTIFMLLIFNRDPLLPNYNYRCFKTTLFFLQVSIS